MSLVLCDVTPNQILFLGDSACPTENTDPLDYPNDAKKVLLSPDRRIGIGLAGTLNFQWQGMWNQSWKWVQNFLQSTTPNQTESPATLVQALKQQIESFRGVPFNNRGIIMIGGFSNGQPEVYELEVKSKSAEVTDLVVSESRPKEFPRVWGVLPAWADLLSLSGVSQTQIPTQSVERHKCLREIMELAVKKLTAAGERKVALPIVSIFIPKPTFAILGWGSLISKPEGDASIGQKPLRISGTFVPGGPSLPIEFSRISQDGRLTLVIDPSQGTPCDTFYAVSSLPDLNAAIQNLAEREGTPVRNIHFASRDETYSDEIKRGISAWLLNNDFDGAVWTGLPPKFQFQDFQGFSTEAAIAYLKSLTGATRDKAFNYITTAPPTVKTPVREAAMQLMRLQESGAS
jgi:hypothetical protein